MLTSAALAQSPASPSTRSMDDLNWMEFQKLVPAHIKTVILTTGTLEPHGIINNGADNTAPKRMAEFLAPQINALIAPHIPYGMTGSLSPYPGALHIPEEAYRPYVKAVLLGLVKNEFKNLIIVNGHGGPQTAILNAVAGEVALEKNVNTLVINWWSAAGDVVKQVFGENGGHAGNNETAYIQAINPKLVHKEWYSNDMATAYPSPGTWSAVPFPSTIGLYEPGQGYPKDFDQKKAEEYFDKVNAKILSLVQDVLKKWERAGLVK
jgi:creatinine amidohydrolase